MPKTVETRKHFEDMQQSSATPKNQDVGRGLQKTVALKVASCFNSHSVTPTSYGQDTVGLRAYTNASAAYMGTGRGRTIYTACADKGAYAICTYIQKCRYSDRESLANHGHIPKKA